MARLARIVISDAPCHVTHRGNRRDDVFFSDQDREVYKTWLAEYAREHDLEIWAYCLMTNHVHLLVLPRDSESLGNTIGRTHMRHARRVNQLQGWSGHLWANRYYSTRWTTLICGRR